MEARLRTQFVIAASFGLAVAWTLPAAPAIADEALAVAGEAVSDQSKTKGKRQSGHRAYGQGQRQIACTQFGCAPIPPGCEIRTGFIPFTWDPSGFDEVVCPYPRRPAR